MCSKGTFIVIFASEPVATITRVALARVRTFSVDTGSIVITAITAIVALVVIHAGEAVTAVTSVASTSVAAIGIGARGVAITLVGTIGTFIDICARDAVATVTIVASTSVAASSIAADSVNGITLTTQGQLEPRRGSSVARLVCRTDPTRA